MKRITIILTIILFLVVGVNSNFNESGAVGNTAIFNKEYEKSEEIFNLEVKEKSDCRTKNFIYNNIVLFILNATVPFLY